MIFRGINIMKIKHLIKELLEFNPNADITTSIAEDISLSYIISRGGQKEYDKHTTPQVFIEPVDCLCCKHYDHCEKSNNVCDDFQLEEIS